MTAPALALGGVWAISHHWCDRLHGADTIRASKLGAGRHGGTGALIARNEALAKLQRPWFACGTITLSSVSAAHLYGPRDTTERAATVAMNFLDPDGTPWDCDRVEALANERRVSLRAGCLLQKQGSPELHGIPGCDPGQR